MPLPVNLLEKALLRLNLLPAPLLDTPLAPGIAQVLLSACELGLFDALRESPLSQEALAQRLCCQPRGLQIILPMLVTTGYLRYQRGRYALTAISRRWLVRDSRLNVAPYILHSPDIVALWKHLPQVVHEGRPAARMPYEEDASQPEVKAALARHYAGLAALAMTLGGEVVRRAHLPTGATRLLDIGGSHAGYSALFCRKYPHLQATIVDIAPGIEAGRCIAKQEGLEERLAFVEADIVREDFTQRLTADYDVALYFHVAHLLSAEANIAALARAAAALRPGGLLLYLDQVSSEARGSSLATLLVQLMNMTMAVVGGTCYPFETVRGWLELVGMKRVRCRRLLTPGVTLITAEKE